MECLKVDLGEYSYPIYIGFDILHKLGSYISKIVDPSKVLIISNKIIFDHYGEEIGKSLDNAGFKWSYTLIPEGEENKNIETANKLWDACFQNQLDRKSLIIALGGGIVGDISGFIAATYMRGIPFIQIPTTLLAQVDSSVGGKVAVNHPQGKNIIGAFYQPKMVFADTKVLLTLPEREIKTGLAEVIKYGVIWDREFFSWLQENQEMIFQLNKEAMGHIVKTSCIIKAKVVGEDEKENGLRAILNYGHTFGHAYEALTKYERYTHGEAVAIGMVSAAITANKLDMISSDAVQKIVELIKAFDLPTNYENLSVDEIINKMYYDKKTTGGKITYIIPSSVGRVEIIKDIPLEVIKEALLKQKNSKR